MDAPTLGDVGRRCSDNFRFVSSAPPLETACSEAAEGLQAPEKGQHIIFVEVSCRPNAAVMPVGDVSRQVFGAVETSPRRPPLGVPYGEQ